MFFVGAVLAGAGFGAGFQGAIRTVVPLAPPHERAGVLSILYVISYLAMGLPAVLAGLLVVHGGGIATTAREYGIAVMLLAATALAGLLARRAPPLSAQTPGSIGADVALAHAAELTRRATVGAEAVGLHLRVDARAADAEPLRGGRRVAIAAQRGRDRRALDGAHRAIGESLRPSPSPSRVEIDRGQVDAIVLVVAARARTPARSRPSMSRSCERIISPSHRIAARDSTFSSSRMLPGQRYACEPRERLRGDLRRIARLAAGEALRGAAPAREDVRGEQRDVLLALAQRRHLDRHDREAPVEVLAELAARDERLEILVRRRDDAHVDLRPGDRRRPA